MKKVNSMQWQIRRDIVKNRVAYFGVFTALALIFSYVRDADPYQFRNPGSEAWACESGDRDRYIR